MGLVTIISDEIDIFFDEMQNLPTNHHLSCRLNIWPQTGHTYERSLLVEDLVDTEQGLEQSGLTDAEAVFSGLAATDTENIENEWPICKNR